MSKTVERTQLNVAEYVPIALLPNCVSAVLATVRRSGRGGHKRKLRVAQIVVTQNSYNKQEWRASPLHRTPIALQSEAAAKKSGTI